MPCGPRWGKDAISIWLSLYVGSSLASQRRLIEWPFPPRVLQWVVTPTYAMGEQRFDEFVAFTDGWPGRRILASPQDRKIELWGGDYVIKFKSTDRPKNLLGEGLDILLVSEAQGVADKAWGEYLSTRLISPDRSGIRIINGTGGLAPSRWYRSLWERAIGGDPDIFMVNEPSWKNPHLTTAQKLEIEKAHQDIGDILWRATYGAELVAEGTGVLRKVPEAHRVGPEQPGDGVRRARHIAFYDPARKYDYNGVVVFRLGNPLRQVYADRWNGTDWAVSKIRLQALSKYPGRLYIDTGFDPYGKDINNATVRDVQSVVGSAVRCEGFKFTNENKERMTWTMASYLERGEIEFLDPALCEGDMQFAVQAQIRELMRWDAFSLEKSGKTQYRAPDGEHDDMAVAAMAAAQKASEDTGDWRPVLDNLRMYG